MATDLLPPNATKLERSVSLAAARVGAIPVDVLALWNPETCPIDLLPWLAWALSIDRWDADWSDARKRAAVATAIELQRTKGTRRSVEAVLSTFDDLLHLSEWFEHGGDPHTFEVRLPVVTTDGIAGGTRASREVVEAIINDVSRTKPARAHFVLVQRLEIEAIPAPIAAMQATGFRRLTIDATAPADISWSTLLQTETGEPLRDDADNFIDGAPA